jgi:hypothetical protein
MRLVLITLSAVTTRGSALSLPFHCAGRSDRAEPSRTNRLRCGPSCAQRDQATTLDLIGLPLVDTGRPYEAEAEFSAALAILPELAKGHPTFTGSRSLLAQVHTKLGTLPEHIWSGLSRPSALPGPSDSAQNDIVSLPEAPNRPTRWGMCLRAQATARIES